MFELSSKDYCCSYAVIKNTPKNRFTQTPLGDCIIGRKCLLGLMNHLWERKRCLLKRGKIDFAIGSVREKWGKLPLPHSPKKAGN